MPLLVLPEVPLTELPVALVSGGRLDELVPVGALMALLLDRSELVVDDGAVALLLDDRSELVEDDELYDGELEVIDSADAEGVGTGSLA